MPYAATADVKAFLKIPTGTTTDDTLIGGFVTRAQSIIERVTGKVYEASADTTRHFDAVRDVDGRLLLFDNQWLAQITSVVNGDGVTIASTDYATEPRNTAPYYGIKLKTSGADAAWTFTDDPEDAIAITGRWAYTTAAPDYIVQATIRLAAWLYKQKDSAADVDRPLLTGDGVTIMPQSLPRDVMQLIKDDIPVGR